MTMTVDELDIFFTSAALHGVKVDVSLEELDLMYKQWILDEYIRARNEAEDLDTPEKRLEALARRMAAAKQAERQAAERGAA
jgi:hypothetical protein